MHSDFEVISAYFDSEFKGSHPNHGFTNKSANAEEYLQILLGTFEYNGMDFRGSVIRH